MEAGIEHLGRATSRSIDLMIIVVEPGSRSLAAANTIMKLAGDIGVKSFGISGNKIQDERQKRWIKDQFPPHLILGTISDRDLIRHSDMNSRPLIDILDEGLKQEFREIYDGILSRFPS
jgi:CO dehydrogenase maturation factor